MLLHLKRFWWHIIVLGLALYVGILYRSSSRTQTTATVTSNEGRKTKDIKNFILKEERRLIEKYCEESTDLCFSIEDRPVLENNNLIVQRVLVYKDSQRFSVSTVELETPQELTWKNFNSRQWSVNKLVVHNFYTRLMIAMGFVMEALKFDPVDWQNVLLIGLGGGTQNNFLSAVDFVKVNLTTVELSPLMVTIATDWFGLLETRTNNVFVEDGVDYLHGAVQRDEKYRSIILDACTDINQSIICPAKDFMRHSVIQDIARILDNEGVLTVNILSSRDYIANEDNILSTFKKHFSTCFLLRYNETQRLLVCTKKERWSFNEQRARFTKNFQNVDDRFDFGLSDVISREN